MVCLALGLARSNKHEKAQRPVSVWIQMPRWSMQDGLKSLHCRPMATVVLVHWPIARSHIGLAAVNHKRYYLVMKQYGLLPPKAPKRRVSSRPHEGKVAVTESNRRWCSDGFEIAYDKG